MKLKKIVPNLIWHFILTVCVAELALGSDVQFKVLKRHLNLRLESTTLNETSADKVLNKLALLPAGTIVAVSKEKISESKNYLYSHSTGKRKALGLYNKNEFISGVQIVSLPSGHRLSEDILQEIVDRTEAGERLYLSKSHFEKAEDLDSQQSFVRKLNIDSELYNEDGFMQINEPVIEKFVDRVVDPQGCKKSVDDLFPAVALSLDFDPVKNHIDRSTILAYSEHPLTEKMIEAAMKGKKGRSINLCYRFVKKALLRAKIVDSYLPGLSAGRAGHQLEENGFVNLLENLGTHATIRSPYDAPKGAILVYEGGRYGHIEIKVGGKGEFGFVSDHFNKFPVTGTRSQMAGRNRKLIGVYIQPELTENTDSRNLAGAS